MGDTTWDDVGRRFGELGRRLQEAWQPDDRPGADADLRDAGDKVRAALDDLAEAISRSTNAPGVREAARDATAGVADALAGTLRQVADRIQRPSSGGGSGEAG
ncbi:MAG: hypothetical protein R2726_22355 [Acidimicrobiales bacterium]